MNRLDCQITFEYYIERTGKDDECLTNLFNNFGNNILVVLGSIGKSWLLSHWLGLKYDLFQLFQVLQKLFLIKCEVNTWLPLIFFFLKLLLWLRVSTDPGCVIRKRPAREPVCKFTELNSNWLININESSNPEVFVIRETEYCKRKIRKIFRDQKVKVKEYII